MALGEGDIAGCGSFYEFMENTDGKISNAPKSPIVGDEKGAASGERCRCMESIRSVESRGAAKTRRMFPQ